MCLLIVETSEGVVEVGVFVQGCFVVWGERCGGGGVVVVELGVPGVGQSFEGGRSGKVVACSREDAGVDDGSVAGVCGGKAGGVCGDGGVAVIRVRVRVRGIGIGVGVGVGEGGPVLLGGTVVSAELFAELERAQPDVLVDRRGGGPVETVDLVGDVPDRDGRVCECDVFFEPEVDCGASGAERVSWWRKRRRKSGVWRGDSRCRKTRATTSAGIGFVSALFGRPVRPGVASSPSGPGSNAAFSAVQPGDGRSGRARKRACRRIKPALRAGTVERGRSAGRSAMGVERGGQKGESRE